MNEYDNMNTFCYYMSVCKCIMYYNMRLSLINGLSLSYLLMRRYKNITNVLYCIRDCICIQFISSYKFFFLI